MTIVLNHAYYLRHDLTRTWIFSRPGLFNRVHSTWTSCIHPIYAMILSFFDKPIEKGEAIKKISGFFEITEEEAIEIINPFIDTNGSKSSTYGGHTSYFPEDILLIDEDIEKNPPQTIEYNPSQFSYQNLDFDYPRLHEFPQSIVWIVNNNCATNCIYCYADKKTPYIPMNWNQIKKMISDIKELGIKELILIGGEVLIHPNWKQILLLLREKGFYIDMISTKIPVTKESLVFLKNLGVHLQFSLDSIDSQAISKTLNVDSNYAHKIQSTIKEADSLGISYQIATVLTRYTANSTQVSSLWGFISQLKHISRWEIRLAFPSLYSQNYNNFKCSPKTNIMLQEWYRNLPEEARSFISIPNIEGKKYRTTEGGAANFIGSRSSANSTNLVILPDGKATICEQLYWNPRFIIGDILTQSIPKIWNSPKALSLANYPKDKVQINSACAKCDIYESCTKAFNRCYADILKAYGDENWDYPDPRCAKANDFLKPFISTE